MRWVSGDANVELEKVARRYSRTIPTTKSAMMASL
jgi:hypothetical protein